VQPEWPAATRVPDRCPGSYRLLARFGNQPFQALRPDGMNQVRQAGLQAASIEPARVRNVRFFTVLEWSSKCLSHGWRFRSLS